MGPAGTTSGKLNTHTGILQTGTGNMATPPDNTRAGQRNGPRRGGWPLLWE